MDSTIEQRTAVRAGVIDFRDPVLRENSMETFLRLQEEGSLPRLKGLRSHLVISYADCEFILSSPDFGFEEIGTQLDEAKPQLANYFSMRRGLMLFQNQPLHRESREEAKQLLATWNAVDLRNLVREELNHCLEDLKAEELPEWDFIALLAKPFVARVAAHLLKLPLKAVNEVAELTHEIADTLDPLGEANSLEETGEYYQRIEAAVENSLSDLKAASGCPYHQHTTAPVAAMLISASVYTTTHLLGLVVHGLLSDSLHRTSLAQGKEVSASAVEELLRYHSPARLTRRVARQRVQIRGQVFEKGTVFWLALGAANRDPRLFVDPLEIQLERTPNRHLAFGKGAHQCLGAQLARIQLQVFLEECGELFSGFLLSEQETRPLKSLVFSGFRTLVLQKG